MNEVLIDSIDGRRLLLDSRSTPDSDGISRFTATMVTEAGRASSGVWEIGDTLATFIRSLATGGFDGVQSYDSLEGQLSFRCTYDGLGTVTCDVLLAQMSPPTWAVLRAIRSWRRRAS